MWKTHFGSAGVAVVAALTAVGCSDLQEISAPETPEATVAASQGPNDAGGPPSDGQGACLTGESIVDLASGNAVFEVLTAAAVREGLVDALDGPQQVTVFAPTDGAFFGTLNQQFGTDFGEGDEQDAIDFLASAYDAGIIDLESILLYHVTRGVRLSPSVVNVPRIRMLSGGFVAVDGTVLNDGQAALLAPDLIDLRACNGVVHAIDGVLLPS